MYKSPVILQSSQTGNLKVVQYFIHFIYIADQVLVVNNTIFLFYLVPCSLIKYEYWYNLGTDREYVINVYKFYPSGCVCSIHD